MEVKRYLKGIRWVINSIRYFLELDAIKRKVKLSPNEWGFICSANTGEIHIFYVLLWRSF